MAKTDKHVSISGRSHAALAAKCARLGVSMRSVVERLIAVTLDAEDDKWRPVKRRSCPTPRVAHRSVRP